MGAVRLAPLGSRSLPALKAFLRGEQYSRRSLWDSALVQYDQTLALDSTFALAHRRMSWVLGWNSAGSARYRPGEEYLRWAVTLNHGLAPRDSLLLVVDSLGLLGLHIDSPTYFDSKRRLSATLAEAQRRYPGDPEIWYSVGEGLYHFQNPDEATEVETLDAFDRAIALDSAFAPAYFHTPGLAIAIDQGDPDRAQHYLAAYLRLNPRDDNSAPLRLTATLLDPPRQGPLRRLGSSTRPPPVCSGAPVSST